MQPKRFDTAQCASWSQEAVVARAVALGWNERAAALAFLATVTQADYDEYQVCRPEPRGNGPPPKRLEVKTAAELFDLARKAAKKGVQPQALYEHFQRDVQRRLSPSERNEIAAILRRPRNIQEAKQYQAEMQRRIAAAQADRQRQLRDAKKEEARRTGVEV